MGLEVGSLVQTLEFELEDDLLNDLRKVFPNSNAPEKRLAYLAFKEWVEWLKGAERPTKISEQNIQRIMSIYSEILSGEVPDAETLYNEFNIPLGQARYITQAISYKSTGALHGLALQDILRAVNENIDKDEDISVIRIKRSSEKLLREIINKLSLNDDTIPPLSVSKDLGKYLDLKLRNYDLPAIKKVIEGKLAVA
jgi:hypothetical protein